MGKIIGLDGKEFHGDNKLPEPNADLIVMLERSLESAKKGYLQEAVIIGSDWEGQYHIGCEVFPTYDPAFMGHIVEASINYRDGTLYDEFYDDEE